MLRMLLSFWTDMPECFLHGLMERPSIINIRLAFTASSMSLPRDGDPPNLNHHTTSWNSRIMSWNALHVLNNIYQEVLSPFSNTALASFMPFNSAQP